MDPWGIDDLTALLARMNGGYPSAALLVLAFGAAFLGNGYGFLRLCGLGGTMRGFALWLSPSRPVSPSARSSARPS